MTEPASHERTVEVTERGHPLAGAEVSTPSDPHGTARVSFHAEAGHLPPGTRRRLVDAVLELPDVRASDHLQASVPLGDVESITRLTERTVGVHIHAAGCTALVDADLPEPCGCDQPAG